MMKLKNILLSCVFIFGSMFLSGCYTQLSMFYPEPEIENDDSENFYQPYSMAAPRVNVGIYAQDGAGQSLGMAYQMMYNRFSGFMGYGNRYNYYNPYFYGGYYRDYNTYNLAGYTMYIPVNTGERKIRTFSTSRDSDSSPETNLNVTRTRSSNTSQSSNSGYSNSSNVSSTRSSSSSSGGRRVTKRH